MKKIIISASLTAVMFLMLLNIGGGMSTLPKMAIPIIAALLTGLAVYFLIDFFENYQKLQDKNTKELATKFDGIATCIKDNNTVLTKSLQELLTSLSNLTENEKTLSEIVKNQSEPIVNAIMQVGKTADARLTETASIFQAVGDKFDNLSNNQANNTKELAAKLDNIATCVKDSNKATTKSLQELSTSLSNLTENEKSLSDIVKNQSDSIVKTIMQVGKSTDARQTETIKIFQTVGDKFDNLSNKFDGIADEISNKIDNVSESIANKMKESSDEFSDILTGKIESMISKTNDVIEKIDEDVIESMQDNFARISKSFEEISDATESLQKADEEEKRIIKMLEKMK